jgi:hypothetical protein
MADDYTSVSIPTSLKRDMNEQRNESESWADYFRRITGNNPTATVQVDSEEIVNGVLDELADQMEINVSIDGESGMNEADVKNLIENELEKAFQDMKRGNL